MDAIPAELQSRYKASLLNKAVSEGEHGAYLRWLRYYLDYESIKGQVNYSSGINNGILEGLSSLVQSAKSKARLPIDSKSDRHDLPHRRKATIWTTHLKQRGTIFRAKSIF